MKQKIQQNDRRRTVSGFAKSLIVALALFTAGAANRAGAADTQPPVPGDKGALSAYNIKTNEMIIAFRTATDNVSSKMTYYKYYSLTNNIATVATCEANGTCAGSFVLANDIAAGEPLRDLTPNTTYYINILVEDEAHNKAVYTMYMARTLSADSQPPTPGNGGAISMMSGFPKTDQATITFTSATDNSTGKLTYYFYYSTKSLSTVTDCEANGVLASTQDFFTNNTKYPMTFNGLAPSTAYNFNIVVKDEAGNKAAYAMISAKTQAPPDTEAPVPGNGGAITVGTIGASYVSINWRSATDNVSNPLIYYFYRSTSNNIATPTACEANGVLDATNSNISNGSGLLNSAYTNLTPNTTYYFNLVVKDEAGNKAAYTMIGAKTLAAAVPPSVETLAATQIAQNSALLNGRLTSDGGDRIREVNFTLYDENNNYVTDIPDTYSATIVGTSYYALVSNLTAGKKYKFRINARNSEGWNTKWNTLEFTTRDTEPPVPGNNGALTPLVGMMITATAIPVRFRTATDNSAGALTYSFYYSIGNNITTIAECEANGTLHGTDNSLSNDATSNRTFNSLTPNTTYYFNIVVADEAGNKAAYKMASATTRVDPNIDAQAPTVTDNTLTVTGITANGFTVSWAKAADNVTPQDKILYKVAVYRRGNIIVAGYPVEDTDISSHIATNLSPASEYTVKVAAFDAAGNSAEYVSKTVTTLAAAVPVTGVSVSPKTLALAAGQTSTLAATVSPANATNAAVTWSSSNATVATVNSSGAVTAVGAGAATIAVRTEDGGFAAACAVTVTSAPPATIFVTGVSVSLSTLNLEEGRSDYLAATVYPANATNTSVTWSSSNASVVTVNSSGAVTAVGAGAALIAVRTEDGGFTAACAVTVSAADGSEQLNAARIYASGRTLYIVQAASSAVRIYGVTGVLVRTLDMPAGETTVTLPQGLYIVQTSFGIEKVIIN